MHSTGPILFALENAPAIILPLIREVPEAILKRRPSAKKWSAHEHACHLAVVHPIFSSRLDLILNEDQPHIRPYLPGEQDADDALLRLDLNESMEKFVSDRQLLLTRLRQLSPDDWARTATHDEYSQYSVLIMFRHLAMHDMFHSYRIEELLLKKDWNQDH